MFVVDALLGNFDRHNGNWGFLVDTVTQETSIAPIYDCGSCLLPQADEKIMMAVLTNENELNARIYQFPTSAVKLNGKKINYHNFITSCEYEECNEAVKRVVPRIDMEQIEALIDNTYELSELQKSFYKRYLNGRYEKILLPAYDQIMEEEQHNSLTM